MPNVSPIQSDFSFGAISPKMQGKTQGAVYQGGLKDCENWRVTPQGSLEFRDGSKFNSDTFEETATLRTFNRLGSNDNPVVIGNNNVTVYNKNGIAPNLQSNLLLNPNFIFGLDDWDVVTFNPAPDPEIGAASFQSEAISGSGFLIKARSAQFVDVGFGRNRSISQTVAIDNTQTYNLNFDAVFLPLTNSGYFKQGQIGVQIENADTNDIIYTDFEIYTYNLNLNPAFDPPLAKTQYPPDFTEISTSVTLAPADLAGVSNVKIILFVATWNDWIYNEATRGDALGPQRYSQIVVQFQNIVFTTESVAPDLAQFPTPPSWVGKLDTLQTDMDSATGLLIFTVLFGEMHFLQYDDGSGQWSFGPFTPTPPDTDVWLNNQPSVCAFHQGRLYLGASPNNLSEIWASKVWDYSNFEIVNTNAAPDDPLNFVLSINAKIQWMKSLKTLLIGTDVGAVTGRSTGSVITNSDFSFDVQQEWGASYLSPTGSGREVLFISNDGRKIRSLLDGGDSSNSYESLETTFYSDHLFLPQIQRIIYGQNPNYQLTALMRDGSMNNSTYFAALDKNGWFKEVTNGSYVGITTAEDTNGSSKWVLVQREDKLLLEEFTAFNELPIYLDSYIVTQGAETINGLDHLEGQTVSVVALTSEGNEDESYTLHPDRTVLNGEISLEYYAQNTPVAVGLAYTGRLVTNKLEGSNPQGTAQTQKRRFNEIFLRLFNSGIPKVNGERPPIRSPQSVMTISEPLYTGDSNTYDAGFNGGVIEIIQDKPLPCNISAIFGKAKGANV